MTRGEQYTMVPVGYERVQRAGALPSSRKNLALKLQKEATPYQL